MRNDVKDVQFCWQGRHMVPRDKIVELLNDNGKGYRNVCEDCKAETLKRRSKSAARR